MYKVDVYLRVRRAVMVEGMSIQETARTFGLHRDTVRKMLAYSVPPGYRRQSPPRKPKLEPFTSVIDRILEDDLRRPRKQRHTVKRIFERLRDEYGFDGQYTIVKDYVREHRRQTKEMLVPLSHPPGHAQCDFGEALVVIGGIERKAHCFVLDLPHSDRCFVKAYPAETTEAFLDGHVSPSPSWAGCPRASSTTTPSWRWPGSWGMDAVNAPAPSPSCSLTTCSRTGSASPARAMTKAKWRAWWGTCAETSWCRCRPSRALMHSMHTWSDVAWNEWTPSSGDIRRPSASVWSGTWTPVAAAASSIRRLQEAVGPGELVVAGPVQDQRLLGAGGLRIPGRAGKRIRGPGGHQLRLGGHRHPRSYQRDDFVYDPIHYLPLLERKPGAPDQAAPLQGWELPDEFGTLRRLLESRMGRRGKREFVQVLRLLEIFTQQEVPEAAKDALRLGAISFDAVKHLVLCRLEGRPPRLDLELYPYLPRVRVSTTSAGDYMTLLSGRAA